MLDERTYLDHATEQITRERGARPSEAIDLSTRYFLIAAVTSFFIRILEWPSWVILVLVPTLIFLVQFRRVRQWDEEVKQRERRLKFEVRGFHAD